VPADAPFRSIEELIDHLPIQENLCQAHDTGISWIYLTESFVYKVRPGTRRILFARSFEESQLLTATEFARLLELADHAPAADLIWLSIDGVRYAVLKIARLNHIVAAPSTSNEEIETLIGQSVAILSATLRPTRNSRLHIHREFASASLLRLIDLMKLSAPKQVIEQGTKLAAVILEPRPSRSTRLHGDLRLPNMGHTDTGELCMYDPAVGNSTMFEGDPYCDLGSLIASISHATGRLGPWGLRTSGMYRDGDLLAPWVLFHILHRPLYDACIRELYGIGDTLGHQSVWHGLVDLLEECREFYYGPD
jgi:hypothetical protein